MLYENCLTNFYRWAKPSSGTSIRSKIILARIDVHNAEFAAIVRGPASVIHQDRSPQVAASSKEIHRRVGDGFTVRVIHASGNRRGVEEAKRQGAAPLSIAELNHIAQLPEVIGAVNRRACVSFCGPKIVLRGGKAFELETPGTVGPHGGPTARSALLGKCYNRFTNGIAAVVIDYDARDYACSKGLRPRHSEGRPEGDSEQNRAVNCQGNQRRESLNHHLASKNSVSERIENFA